MSGEFTNDIRAIRQRARKHIERGAVTASYQGKLKVVLRLLNEALAIEIARVLRYSRNYYMAKGIHSEAVAAEFLEHAGEEQGHANRIAARISQLGGAPDFNPEGLGSCCHSEYVEDESLFEGESLIDMIQEDLVGERIAIESYSEMIRYIGNSDPTTRSMLEGTLATGEEYAEDMATLLASLDPERKTA